MAQEEAEATLQHRFFGAWRLVGKDCFFQLKG